MAKKQQSVLIPATMLVISLVLANKAARAQGSIELMCRNKAKEIAFQTYNGCVTEEKATRLNDLKERYKSRMSEVKDEFQRELDDINGKKTPEAPAAKPAAKAPAKTSAKAAKPGRAEKPAAGVATTLPSKQNDNGPAQLIQTDTQDQAVITMKPATDEMSEPEIVEVSN